MVCRLCLENFWGAEMTNVTTLAQSTRTAPSPERLQLGPPPPSACWGVGGGRLPRGPTWAAAAPRPPRPRPRTWHVPLQAADHLSGTPGRAGDFCSLPPLFRETDSFCISRPRSSPFNVRSSCLASGKCHKGFCLPCLTSTSGKCSLMIDPSALI